MNESGLSTLRRPSCQRRDAAAGGAAEGEPAWARSRDMRQLLLAADRLSLAGAPVVLIGETGSGKDWIAHLLHGRRGRDAELLGLRCEGLAAERLEAPDGSTLLLQELGQLPVPTQQRLVELLDRLEPPGNAEPTAARLASDLRIIATSTEDLARSVHRGALLPGLYYRLAAVELHIPPLRERKEDIEGLVAVLLSELEQKYDLGPFAVTDDLLEAMRRAPWPGNVRQLRAVLERAMLFSTQDLLDTGALPPDWACAGVPSSIEVRIGTSLPEAERRLILETLQAVGGQRLQAAKVLGISRRKLHYRLHQYRVEGLPV